MVHSRAKTRIHTALPVIFGFGAKLRTRVEPYGSASRTASVHGTSSFGEDLSNSKDGLARFMTNSFSDPTIDQYLRERLMPVEGVIPHIPGIEMFGNSIPAAAVGGDLFEYINFQQRYDIDARIQQAQRLSKAFLEPLPPGALLRNSVDDQVQWLKTTQGYRPEMEGEYRFARSSEQVRVVEGLRDLYSSAGVL